MAMPFCINVKCLGGVSQGGIVDSQRTWKPWSWIIQSRIPILLICLNHVQI